MKNTFNFFVSKAKPFLKRKTAQMHFKDLKPKRRTVTGKINIQGDARGLALIGGGVGVAGVGVGEGVRRARKRGKNAK